MIVLGGSQSQPGYFLLPAITQALKQNVLAEVGQQVNVRLSAFGADAILKRAVALVFEDVFMNYTRVKCTPLTESRIH